MRKRTKVSIMIFIIVATSGLFAAKQYFGADFMDLKTAKKKWGVKTFESSQFKSKNYSARAPMAVDIVQRSLFVGKGRDTIRQELGDPDSYFFSDTIYAYKIMEFPGANQENWHLVFIPDENLEKVKEVKIHKKCCYKKPF